MLLAQNYEDQELRPGQVASNREAMTFGDFAKQLKVDPLVLMHFLMDHQATIGGAVRGAGIEVELAVAPHRGDVTVAVAVEIATDDLGGVLPRLVLPERAAVLESAVGSGVQSMQATIAQHGGDICPSVPVEVGSGKDLGSQSRNVGHARLPNPGTDVVHPSVDCAISRLIGVVTARTPGAGVDAYQLRPAIRLQTERRASRVALADADGLRSRADERQRGGVHG